MVSVWTEETAPGIFVPVLSHFDWWGIERDLAVSIGDAGPVDPKPALCQNDTRTGLAWSGADESGAPILQFAQFHSNLQRRGAVRELATGGVNPSVAGVDGRYRLVWQAQDSPEPGRSTVHYVELDGEGDAIAPARPLAPDSGGDIQSAPVLAWLEGKVGVAWVGEHEGQAQLYARVWADGDEGVADSAYIVSSDALGVSHPAIAARPEDREEPQAFGVVWIDRRDDPARIYFRALGDAAQPDLPDLPVSDGEGEVGPPRIIKVGSSFAVIWSQEMAPDRWAVLKTVVSPDDTESWPLAFTPSVYNARNPAIALTRSRYGFIWEDDWTGQSRIYFLRDSLACPEVW